MSTFSQDYRKTVPVHGSYAGRYLCCSSSVTQQRRMPLEFRQSLDKRTAGIAGVSADFSRNEHRECRRVFRTANRNEKCFQREEKFQTTNLLRAYDDPNYFERSSRSRRRSKVDLPDLERMLPALPLFRRIFAIETKESQVYYAWKRLNIDNTNRSPCVPLYAKEQRFSHAVYFFPFFH